jgi:microcompartment protein CcmK/EutM
MQVARVVGTVVCAHKDERLSGVTLLLIQPLAKDGAPFGRTLVATDAAGAGIGEDVFFVRGAEASFPFAPRIVPTDASIVGIVDSVYT